MGQRLIFPSTKEPNHRYVVYGSMCDNPTSGKGLDYKLTAYDTYGDGDVQHCHEWSVQPDCLDDFLRSFCLYLCEHDHNEWLDVAWSFWPSDHPDKALLNFAATPLYKEDAKRNHRYFNLREQKVSTADGKSYDKRWSPVTDNLDGSFAAFLVLMHRERPDGWLALYMLFKQAFDYVEKFSAYDAISTLKIDHNTWHRRWDDFRFVNNVISTAKQFEVAKENCVRKAEQIRHEMKEQTVCPKT